MTRLRLDPDWRVPPGETLAEWVAENGLPEATVLRTLDLSPRQLANLTAGRRRIDPALAARLERLTFIPARFWLALEHNYRR